MRLINKLIRRSPKLTSLDIDLRLRRAEWRDEAAIIVYQMGKVGSSTAVASLRASGLQQRIYHIHSLTGQGFDSRKHMYERMFPGQPIDLQRMRHLLVSEQLQKRLGNGRRTPKWKVITLVRDPVARNISDFFQVIDYWLPGFEQRVRAGELEVDELISTFMREYHHDEPLNWFDIELKQVLGVDVFASEFPKSAGFNIYKRDRVEVLVLKLEQLNASSAAAFGDFLGLENVDIIGANAAEDKDYHSLYKQFKSGLKLPDEYLQEMYTSKYAQQFYSADEIQQFHDRWKR